MGKLQELEIGGTIANQRVVWKQSYIRKDLSRTYLFITILKGKMPSVWISNQEVIVKLVKRHPKFKACVIYCLKRMKKEINLVYREEEFY